MLSVLNSSLNPVADILIRILMHMFISEAVFIDNLALDLVLNELDSFAFFLIHVTSKTRRFTV